MDNSSFISKIRTLLSKNDLGAANQILLQILANNPKLDVAIQQSGRYEFIKAKLFEGSIDVKEANVFFNQIRFALLELVRDIEKEGVKEGLDSLLDEIEELSKVNEFKSYLKQAAQQIQQQAEKIYNIGHIDQANFS